MIHTQKKYFILFASLFYFVAVNAETLPTKPTQLANNMVFAQVYLYISLGILLLFILTSIIMDSFKQAILVTLGIVIGLALLFSIYEWLQKETTTVKTKSLFNFEQFEK